MTGFFKRMKEAVKNTEESFLNLLNRMISNYENRSRKRQLKKNNFSKRSTRIILICTIYLLFGVCMAAGIFSFVFGKIDFMSEKDMVIPDDLDSIVLAPESSEIVSESDTIDDMQMETINENIATSMVNEEGLRYEDGVTNVLILGTDGRREAEGHTRSDVIIIMSVNENSKKITLSSIMRDTYVAIPGRKGNDKINAAHAYGGPALTVQTVEKAFGIRIDKFVRVNFYSFMDVIDALGGVTLDISSGEREVLNRYVKEINKYINVSPDDGFLLNEGENLLLTGKQAMGYVRIRYVGDGDYERTLRQRRVLEQVVEKARESDPLTLLSIVDKISGNVTTDFNTAEITSLAMKAPEYKEYEISQLRIPVEGSYWGGIYKGAWILDIDFEKNKEALYAAVFD